MNRILDYLRSNIVNIQEKGFFDLLIVRFLTQFLGFGTTLLVAKFITPVELGEIKILQSYTAVLVIFAGFGFNTAVLKICSEDRSEKEKHGVLKLAFHRTLISVGVVFALVLGLSLTNVITSSQRLSFWLIIFSLSIPFSVLTNLLIAFLQSQKQIKVMARSQAIIKLESVILIIASTWIWGFRGFIFATILAYAVGLIPLLKEVGLDFLKVPDPNTPGLFTRYAVFSVLANGVSTVGQRGDVFILDHFAADRELIGYYSLAVIFVTAASQVTGTVQSIVTPYFSERAGQRSWFLRQLITNQVRMTLLSLLVGAAVYAGASLLVPIIYGPSYQPTLTFLLVLLIKYVIWSSYAVVGPALMAMGLIHYNLITASIATPIGLLLSYLFLQQMGIIGAAWAQVLQAVLTFFLMMVAAWVAIRR
jgi:O-antigen/teichoic acid export membrane protein